VLREIVAASGLEAGELFAVEAELEKELNVSRPVLREAVSRLRALGILRSRQGVGLIVAKPDPIALFEQAITGYAVDSVDLAQLGELRYSLEIGAVELVVKRATRAQLARLAELAEEFARSHAGEPSARMIDDVEMAFHCTILESTHNATLMRMHYVLAAFFVRSAKEVEGYAADQASERIVWDHRAIAHAFGQRSVERARALLSGHLESLIANGPSELGPDQKEGA
jgi:DNA-binding FadR family transcriptional regulator